MQLIPVGGRSSGKRRRNWAWPDSGPGWFLVRVQWDHNEGPTSRQVGPSLYLLSDPNAECGEIRLEAQWVRILLRKSLARLDFGLMKNSLGVFSSTIWPSDMNATRLAARRAKPISWVTTTIVMPSPARPVMTSRTSLIISGPVRRSARRRA